MRGASQSMSSRAPLVMALGLALSVGGGIPEARACAICSEIPGASGELGPRLLEIALAIRHEIDSGGLEQATPGASLPTSGRVLGRRISGLLRGRADAERSFELLLIDSGARFRFDPAEPERGFVAVPARKASPSPALRWITGLDVFHALLEGRIGVDTAQVRGILVIETVSKNDPFPAEAVEPDDLPPGATRAEEQSAGITGWLGPLLLPGSLAVLILIPILLVFRSSRATVAGAGLR